MSFVSKAVGWLFGSTGTAEKALDLADKAIDTSQERSERDTQDLESARQFAGVSGQPGVINQLCDAANRIQRPLWGFYLFSWVMGWAKPPEITQDEFWAVVFLIYFTFWFGGRAILKDLPSAIKLMRGK
jgi:hypothetical protein